MSTETTARAASLGVLLRHWRVSSGLPASMWIGRTARVWQLEVGRTQTQTTLGTSRDFHAYLWHSEAILHQDTMETRCLNGSTSSHRRWPMRRRRFWVALLQLAGVQPQRLQKIVFCNDFDVRIGQVYSCNFNVPYGPLLPKDIRRVAKSEVQDTWSLLSTFLEFLQQFASVPVMHIVHLCAGGGSRSLVDVSAMSAVHAHGSTS